MYRGRKTGKINVTPPLPICGTCPWKIWCKQLNFRTMDPQKQPIKVCPIWWAMMNYMREKGITPKGPPRSMSKKDASKLYEALKRQRTEKLGFGG